MRVPMPASIFAAYVDTCLLIICVKNARGSIFQPGSYFPKNGIFFQK